MKIEYWFDYSGVILLVKFYFISFQIILFCLQNFLKMFKSLLKNPNNNANHHHMQGVTRSSSIVSPPSSSTSLNSVVSPTSKSHHHLNQHHQNILLQQQQQQQQQQHQQPHLLNFNTIYNNSTNSGGFSINEQPNATKDSKILFFLYLSLVCCSLKKNKNS